MPAIQPARLKIQVAELAAWTGDPPSFKRQLRELLDFYADRAHRPGRPGDPSPLLESYAVPPPVLRRVALEVQLSAGSDREALLNLCDALWAEPVLEFRALAATLLGTLPPEHPEDILQRVKAWAEQSSENRLIRILIEEGLANLATAHTDEYLGMASQWLESTRIFQRHLGLVALQALLSRSEFVNLPVVMKMVAPLVRSAPASLRPDLLDLTEQLASRWPAETAYFLRQNLAIKTENPGTAWLTRHSLPYFPSDLQAVLRTALREQR